MENKTIGNEDRINVKEEGDKEAKERLQEVEGKEKEIR